MEPHERTTTTAPFDGRGASPRMNGSANAREQQNSRKRIFLVVGGIVIFLAAIFVVREYRYAAIHESTDDAYIDAHITPISAQVSGQITQVLVKDNQPVKSGDLLVSIDDSAYRAKLDEARAKVHSAETEAKRSASDARRYEQLLAQDEISQQQLENARAAASSAKATLEKEQAALKQAEIALDDTKISAPQDGLVTKKSVELGSYVQAGQAILAVVPEQVWVTANFKETQLTHMRAGQSVTAKIDAYPGKIFHGHVDSIQAGTGERFSLMPSENATGNFVKVVQRIPVKIVLDDPQNPKVLLVPGMSVVPDVDIR